MRRLEVGLKYRFIMKEGEDRWGELLRVLRGYWVVTLLKPLELGGYVFARGAGVLIRKELVERVVEVM